MDQVYTWGIFPARESNQERMLRTGEVVMFSRLTKRRDEQALYGRAATKIISDPKSICSRLVGREISIPSGAQKILFS